MESECLKTKKKLLFRGFSLYMQLTEFHTKGLCNDVTQFLCFDVKLCHSLSCTTITISTNANKKEKMSNVL